MMTDTELQEQEAAFKRALDAFEKCIDTPFVPGELKSWMEAVSQAFHRLADLLQVQRKQMHSAEFQDIGREDPGLLQRVKAMRAEDREIAAQGERLEHRIAALKPQIEKVGPDEAALREELNQLVEQAQEFVVRVRQQEVTVRTWWVEAFMRDRGTVD